VIVGDVFGVIYSWEEITELASERSEAAREGSNEVVINIQKVEQSVV